MLVLPPELTHRQASACLRMLVQGLRAQKARDVVVDASALQNFDSSALAVLLEFRRECLASGKQLVVSHLSPRLSDLAVVYGIDSLLTTT